MLAVAILLLIAHLLLLVVMIAVAVHLNNIAGALGLIARAWSFPMDHAENDEERDKRG